MTTFKDDVERDIKNVFIDLTEFSDYHTVDGVIIPCIVNSHTGDKSLHGDFMTLHFKATDYTVKRERLPRHGEWIYLDGKRYDVISVQNDMGVAKITISAYRQNTLRQNPFDGSVNPYV